MLSKLTSTLQSAVDVIAPPCARIEDFKYHWQQVLQECQKCQDLSGKCPIIVSEETHAPRHLKQMLRIIVQDSAESLITTTLTPCLEFIVQEGILISLVSFAWADRPLGIRQYVFMFLSQVLIHLHHSYLHQMKIHKPLQAMIKATCEKKASPYENQEMEFLSIICEKICEDASIILLYIEPLMLTCEAPTGYTPNISGNVTPTSTRISESEDSSTTDNTDTTKIGSKFPLVEALLNLCHSNDSYICSQAHDYLLAITNLKEPRSSDAMVKHTLLSHYIASRLMTAAENIPRDTEPALVEDVTISEKDRAEINCSDSEEEDSGNDLSSDFPGKKEAVEFFRWLIFFDKLISGCDCLLATSICSIVRELFLEGFFTIHLINTEEEDDFLALITALLTKMLLVVSSSTLVNCLVLWLTEDSEEGDSMRFCLLKRCTKPPHNLQIQTLRLLQVMIEKPGFLAVQLLALNYVSNRGYYDSSAAEHQQNSWSDEEDERYKQREDGDLTPGALPFSRTLAPANINKIVKGFLSMVPEEIRSTNNEDFDSYKADAMRQYREVCRRTPCHTWPREALAPEVCSDSSSTASKESRAEAERHNGFYEGPLLSMLLDFLESLPEQDYDVNLQVTSLVSSMALIPHPYLHEYLLNNSIPLNEGIRTPFTVLSTVISRIHHPIMSKPNFKNYLKVTRFQLLGTMEELEYERDDDDNKFEALVVIEEFIKELAAIAYSKYTYEGNMS